MSYSFTVNGRTTEVDMPGLTPLLRVLREELGLRGAKQGCGEGRCGSCTVMVDGSPVVSCLYPLALIEGRAVRTVEGLAASDEALSPIQDALLEHGAVQCGACTPGVVMSLTALLESDAEIDERAVTDALSGNICRCTGYRKIIDATLAVAGAQEGR